jgi:hypothetical protein
VGFGVTFSEQIPSKHWAALKFRGEKFAEVWFKPEGEPFALSFRIPRSSFQIPGIVQRLTLENLLKAVALTTDEVDSWRQGDSSHSALAGSGPEMTSGLSQPPHDVRHLEIYVRLKPPSQPLAHNESGEPEVASAAWHDLEARWKAILGLEGSVDTLRKSVEGVRAQLEAELRRMLPADEKVNALAADVAQWSKAKSRAHYALPKANEFIHRATWAAGTPERKKLGEIFKNPLENHTSLALADEVLQELEYLRKDRQVLSAQGVTVYQECKTIAADVQAALRRLQSNAASRASKKKGGTGAKGNPH